MMSEIKFSGKLLTAQDFIAFDTETTGLNAAFHRIVEIGAVRFRLSDDDFQKFSTLVNPDRPMPPEVIPIHGITGQMVADAPLAETALAQFAEFCGDDAILLAHNAPFDLSFLACESDRTGIPIPPLPVLDTVAIARVFFPGLVSYSLELLTRTLELAPSQEHRALADALLVRTLFQTGMATRDDLVTVDDLLSAFMVDYAHRYSAKATELPPHLEDFQVAVEQKLRIEIEYRSAGGTTETRVIRPFLIQSRQSVLYITAFCERAKAERTFRTDRIIRFRTLDPVA